MYRVDDLLVLERGRAIYRYVHNVDLFLKDKFLFRDLLEPVDIKQSIYLYLTARDMPKPTLRTLMFPAVESVTPLQAFSYDYELPDQYTELLGAINGMGS